MDSDGILALMRTTLFTTRTTTTINDDHFYIIPDFIPDFHNYTPLNVLLLIYVEIALVKLPQNVFRTGYAIFLQVQEKSGDKHGEADVSAHNDHENID